MLIFIFIYWLVAKLTHIYLWPTCSEYSYMCAGVSVLLCGEQIASCTFPFKHNSFNAHSIGSAYSNVLLQLHYLTHYNPHHRPK